MKVLLCSNCVDIRAMHPTGKPTSCRCGSVTAWWTDPARGTVAVYAENRDIAWIIGLHNGFLQGAIQGGMGTPWRELHDSVTENADGYIFHRTIRNCWAAPVQPGWTNDIRWATKQELDERMEAAL